MTISVIREQSARCFNVVNEASTLPRMGWASLVKEGYVSGVPLYHRAGKRQCVTRDG